MSGLPASAATFEAGALGALTEYTFVPYRGTLAANMPAGKVLVETRIVLHYWDTGTKKMIPVNADLEKKRIYIEEKNFNSHWKEIKAVVLKERRIQSAPGEAAVLSGPGERDMVDLSLYENESRKAVLCKNQIKIVGKPLSEEARMLQSKRASAMDSKKIRYVFSEKDNIVHDKACSLVKNISDRDFRASEELPENRILCCICTKMIYIRKACGDDFKNFGMYQHFFRRGRVGRKEIDRLVNEYGAAIHMEDGDTMRIKCGEDQWKLTLNNDGGVTLLHNNYVMVSDTERYISGGYHDQKLLPGCTLTGALRYIEGYTWDGHLQAMAVRRADEQIEQIEQIKQAAEKPAAVPEKENESPRTRPWLLRLCDRIREYFMSLGK